MLKRLGAIVSALVLAFAPSLSLAASSTVNALTASPAIVGSQLFYCPVGVASDYKCTATQVGAFVYGQMSGAINVSGTGVVTLPTVNANVGACGSSTAIPTVTLNAGGQATACTTNSIAAPLAGITGLGANVGTALAATLNGSGALSATTSPVFVTPSLGTINSGNLAAGTGYTVANLAGAGTGVLTAAGNPVNASGGFITYGSGVCPTTIGTSATLSGAVACFVCTATCTVTLPIPAAGVQYCIQNDTGVASTIQVTPTGSQVTNTSYAYKSPNGTAITSSGALGDQMCFLGRDATHYLLGSFTGSWT